MAIRRTPDVRIPSINKALVDVRRKGREMTAKAIRMNSEMDDIHAGKILGCNITSKGIKLQTSDIKTCPVTYKNDDKTISVLYYRQFIEAINILKHNNRFLKSAHNLCFAYDVIAPLDSLDNLSNEEIKYYYETIFSILCSKKIEIPVNKAKEFVLNNIDTAIANYYETIFKREKWIDADSELSTDNIREFVLNKHFEQFCNQKFKYDKNNVISPRSKVNCAGLNTFVPTPHSICSVLETSKSIVESFEEKINIDQLKELEGFNEEEYEKVLKVKEAQFIRTDRYIKIVNAKGMDLSKLKEAVAYCNEKSKSQELTIV